jgi:tetratricopeptide (TPR) repeat protein
MISCKNFLRTISLIVIFTFLFQSELFMYSATVDELNHQFLKAKNEYINGQYIGSKNRLERLIGIINEEGLDRKDILGKCYILLGMIYEKEDKVLLAEENYRRAKDIYSIQAIDGVDLESLKIYKKVIKGEQPITPGTIDTLFREARNEYNNGQYDNAKNKLEQAIGMIKKQGFVKEDILGKCYLLLGAIYEKFERNLLAEEFYRKAKKKYKIIKIEGVDLDDLPIFGKVVKGIGIITHEGTKNGKKKFPVLLVVGGVAVVAGLVLLLTKKKEVPPPTPNPEFITSTDSLNVPEGGTAAFEVRLSAQPTSDVSVSVTPVSGDTDIIVQSGSSLTFTTTNWNQNQTVTLAASEDQDTSHDTATIRLSASGISNKDITAAEQDNDVLRFDTNTDSVTVREGQTATFQVRLSHQPSSDIQATVSWVSGDTDISVQSGGNPTFSASNWNEYQTVTLIAVEDSDTTDGQAVFRIIADNIEDKYVTAIEDDNDGYSGPTVEITRPKSNETITRGVVYNIEATATSKAGIEVVKFYVDGFRIGSDTSAPYSIDWYTISYSEGTHTIRVVVQDNTGKTDDDQVTVNISL